MYLLSFFSFILPFLFVSLTFEQVLFIFVPSFFDLLYSLYSGAFYLPPTFLFSFSIFIHLFNSLASSLFTVLINLYQVKHSPFLFRILQQPNISSFSFVSKLQWHHLVQIGSFIAKNSQIQTIFMQKSTFL
jgi:hypothetical protein